MSGLNFNVNPNPNNEIMKTASEKLYKQEPQFESRGYSHLAKPQSLVVGHLNLTEEVRENLIFIL